MAINMHANQISEALLSAAWWTISQSSDKRSSGARLPGWSKYVDPLRAKAMFERNLWVECGRPRSEAVADVMRRTRALYHYAVRRVKLNERNILNERFAEPILNDDSRNFWSEVSVCGVRSRVRVVWLMMSLRLLILHLFLPQNIKNCTRASIFIKSR